MIWSGFFFVWLVGGGVVVVVVVISNQVFGGGHGVGAGMMEGDDLGGWVGSAGGVWGRELD